MAWPHRGRILGRRAACEVSELLDTRGIWKLFSSAAGQSPVTGCQNFLSNSCRRNSVKSRDCGLRDSLQTGGNCGASSETIGRSCSGIDTRSAGDSRNVRQASRQALSYHQPQSKYLHSSSVGSEPSATAARTSEASHVEDVETVYGVSRSNASGVSELDLLRMEDGRNLYSGMTSKELAAALFNLQLVSYEPMVDLSLKVLTSRVMTWPVTSIPILWLVRRTAYSHFCAGEDAAEAGDTVKRLWELGVKGILDYSLEDVVEEKYCDENCAGFLNTINMSSLLPNGSVSFVCVKISALCSIALLERVSDHLRWQHKNPKYKLSWMEDGLPVLAPESPTYCTPSTPEALSSEEEADFVKAQQRFRQLCEAAAKFDLPILIDAEYSAIQPAIDYISYAAAFEFNVGGRRVVYGTMQTYLKDAPARLSLAISEASKRNVSMALKLVRGAYITRENSLAASLGAPSPIHDSIEETHKCYEFCSSMMLNHVASGNSAVMFATHNSDSGKFAARRAEELGLDRADPRVQFAQLKGMADSLSLGLAQAGFNVSKYLPFGPVTQVIPYLVRRAEENRGLLGNTLADRQRMRKELGRRLGSGAGLKQFA